MQKARCGVGKGCIVVCTRIVRCCFMRMRSVSYRGWTVLWYPIVTTTPTTIPKPNGVCIILTALCLSGCCQKKIFFKYYRCSQKLKADAAAIQHYTEYGLHGVHISPRVIAVLVPMRIQDDCSEGIHLSRNTNTLNIEQ